MTQSESLVAIGANGRLRLRTRYTERRFYNHYLTNSRSHRRPTTRSAIRSLETTHRDSFAQSVGDERERTWECKGGKGC